MNTLKPKLKWIFCLVVTVVVFTSAIPLSIYNLYSEWFSIFGGTLIGVFLILSMMPVRAEDKVLNTEQDDEDWKPVIAVGVIVIFLSGFVLFGIFDSKVAAELKDGSKTQGTVVSVKINQSSRGRYNPITNDVYTARIRFTTTEGKQITIKRRLSVEEYQKYKPGTTIDIAYSKRDPQIAELISNEDAIRQYTGRQDRIVQLKDLLALMDIPNVQAGDFLNTISYTWDYNESDQRWENTRRDISISIDSGVSVLYRMSIMEREAFEYELLEAGFIKEGEENGKRKGTFRSERYSVAVTHDLIQNGASLKMFKVIKITRNIST